MIWSPSLVRFDATNEALWAAWQGYTPDKNTISLFAYEWEVPDPAKTIRSVTLIGDAGSKASVFLIALTGIR